MAVPPSNFYAQQRYNLDVAVVIPEATRAISTATLLPEKCIGEPTVNGAFGIGLQNIVSDRMQRLFAHVSATTSAAIPRQQSLTFVVTLDSIPYHMECAISPGSYVQVQANLRALNARGDEVWHARVEQLTRKIEYRAIFAPALSAETGEAISAAMGALADQWAQEFANLSPQMVASMVGSHVAALPTTQNISSFPGGQQTVQPPPATKPAVSDHAMELAYWQSVKDSSNPADFEAYLQQYPTGTFAGLARSRLQSLKSAQEALPPNGPAPAVLRVQRRVALVVGNAQYHNVARLANTATDAKLMAAVLKKLGFELVGNGPLLDLDREGLARAVTSFGLELGRDSSVGVFYYAGHGLQVQGENYLVPVDANPEKPSDVDFQMIDTNAVMRQMEDSGAKLKVVILDACRNNPFGGRGLRDAGGGLAQMRAPEGTMISYATQPGNVAQDGSSGSDSPYTLALAQTMQRPGLEVLQMFNQVGVMVDSSTNHAQQPWFSASPISGQFFFAGR